MRGANDVLVSGTRGGLTPWSPSSAAGGDGQPGAMCRRLIVAYAELTATTGAVVV